MPYFQDTTRSKFLCERPVNVSSTHPNKKSELEVFAIFLKIVITKQITHICVIVFYFNLCLETSNIAEIKTLIEIKDAAS